MSPDGYLDLVAGIDWNLSYCPCVFIVDAFPSVFCFSLFDYMNSQSGFLYNSMDHYTFILTWIPTWEYFVVNIRIMLIQF